MSVTKVLSFYNRFINIPLSVVMFLFVYVAPTHAQFTVSGAIGGPTTTIIVVNDTSDNTPILADIGGKTPRGSMVQGNRWGRTFGMFASNGDIPVFAVTCNSSEETRFRLHPPDWATNTQRLGTLALTEAYLATEPSQPELKRRVDEIKKSIKHDLGKKEMEQELKEFLRSAEAKSLNQRGNLCENPRTLAAVTFHGGLYWDSYYYQNKVTILIVRGSRENGYHFEGPRYVY